MMKEIILIYLAAINIGAFLMYGIDKQKAIRNRWRIPETTLLGVALIGGSAGALLGMQMFRHKTKHWKFKILVPVFLIAQIILILYLG